MGFKNIFRLIDTITGLNDKPLLVVFLVSVLALGVAGLALFVVHSAVQVAK